MHRLVFAFLLTVLPLSAEDGYRLWLRYDRVENAPPIPAVVLTTPTGRESPTLAAAWKELTEGLTGLLGAAPRISLAPAAGETPGIGAEGYALVAQPDGSIRITANSDVGVLYGAFALLRYVQTGQPVRGLNVTSSPKISRRLLNHWDNLDGFIE